MCANYVPIVCQLCANCVPIVCVLCAYCLLISIKNVYRTLGDYYLSINWSWEIKAILLIAYLPILILFFSFGGKLASSLGPKTSAKKLGQLFYPNHVFLIFGSDPSSIRGFLGILKTWLLQNILNEFYYLQNINKVYNYIIMKKRIL